MFTSTTYNVVCFVCQLICNMILVLKICISYSCFTEVHSTPGSNFSSLQTGASSSGGVVCGVSPPIPQRQGNIQPVPVPCSNPYHPPTPLGLLRHSLPCQSHQHHQPIQQPHIKLEHCTHYTPGWVSKCIQEIKSNKNENGRLQKGGIKYKI